MMPVFTSEDPDPKVFWHSSSVSHVVELAVHSFISSHFVPSADVPKFAGSASLNPVLHLQE